MLANERQRLICEQVRRDGQAQVSALAAQFGVTEETIRRDIILLDRNKRLRRVHGGAVPTEALRLDAPFEVRASENREGRERVGRAAAGRVRENEVIALDTGVTAVALASALTGGRGVSVITASVPVLEILMEKRRSGEFLGRVYFLGGLLNEQTQAMSGSLTMELLARFSIDRAFVAATAVDQEGLYMSDADSGSLTRAMILRARECILLSGSEKLGKKSLYRCASLGELSELITDGRHPCPAPLQRSLKESGVRLTIV